MKINIEIRAGEGGQDAKLLVKNQADMYLTYARLRGISARVVGSGLG